MNTMDARRIFALSVVTALNDFLAHDRDAIALLTMHVVPCNKKLLNHPLVQTREIDSNLGLVGMLGIINGLVGVIDEGPCKGCGLITAVFDDDRELLKFTLTGEHSKEEPEKK